MKINKLFAAAVLAACSSSYAGLLDEGFNDVATLAGKGWVQNNESVPIGSIGWFQGNTGVFSAAEGNPNSYIAANFNSSSPFGGSISNWLISPSVTFTGPVTLNFALRLLGEGFLDKVEVYYNPLGTTTLGNFSLVDSYESDTDTGWVNHSLSIGTDGANTGRFAFRYVVANTDNAGNYIGVDSVSVVPEPVSLALVGLGLAGLAIGRRRRAA